MKKQKKKGKETKQPLRQITNNIALDQPHCLFFELEQGIIDNMQLSAQENILNYLKDIFFLLRLTR